MLRRLHCRRGLHERERRQERVLPGCVHSSLTSFETRIALPATVAGEFVLLDAAFSNLSSRRVVPEAVLCQTQTFSAGGKTRVRKSKFASLSGRGIAAGAEEERWDALPLKIPAVTPTIANCSLVRVEYAIKVTFLHPARW